MPCLVLYGLRPSIVFDVGQNLGHLCRDPNERIVSDVCFCLFVCFRPLLSHSKALQASYRVSRL